MRSSDGCVVFVGIETPEGTRDRWDLLWGRVYQKTASAIGSVHGGTRPHRAVARAVQPPSHGWRLMSTSRCAVGHARSGRGQHSWLTAGQPLRHVMYTLEYTAIWHTRATFRHASREAMPGCGAVQAWVSDVTYGDGAAGCGYARMLVSQALQPLRDQTEASQGNTREEASG